MTTFFGKTVTVSAERQLHVGDTMSNFTLMSSDLTLKSLRSPLGLLNHYKCVFYVHHILLIYW